MHTYRMLGLIALVTLLSAPLAAGQNKGTTYGAAITVKEADAVGFARVQGQPSSLEGQTIRVDGKVSAIGTKHTCWFAFIGTGGSDYGVPVFVRADPCNVTFPKTIVGQVVTVQGVMMPLRLDPDPMVKEVAAEYGQSEIGGALPLWELKATGVVVQ
jgi:hypothetical protein